MLGKYSKTSKLLFVLISDVSDDPEGSHLSLSHNDRSAFP